jgi:hypothetical protein
VIAFIRARFPATLAADLWSDAIVQGFMDPAIPCSLAHYWQMSTFGQIDLAYQLFAPVVLDDPRPEAVVGR